MSVLVAEPNQTVIDETGTYSYYSFWTYFIIENTMLYSISGLDEQKGRNICPDWTL